MPQKKKRTLPFTDTRELILTLSVLVAFGCFASRAQAGKCDPTDNDIQAAQLTISKVNSRLDRLEANVVNTLKLQTGQNSAYIVQQTTAIGRMFDAQNQSNAQIAREREKIDATRDFLPSGNACKAVSGIVGLKAATRATGDVAKQQSKAQVARLTNSAGSSSDLGQAKDTAQKWKSRNRLWCSSDLNPAAKGICSGLAANHNADINPSSLYGHNTLESDLSQRAARDFIDNIIAPLTPDPLPLAEITDDQKRKEYKVRLSAQARIALAANTLNESYAERLPTIAHGDWARAILPTDTEIPDNISLKELQSILLRDRFLDPNYFISLQEMAPENVNREAVSLQALSLSHCKPSPCHYSIRYLRDWNALPICKQRK